jgi:hypothetical protein
VLAACLNLLLIAIGLAAILTLPIREYPDIDPPVVSVSVTYRGAPAEVVEREVTKVIEDNLSGLDELRLIRSTSRDETAQITVEFRTGANLDAAAADVRDRVSAVRRDLPTGIEDPVIEKASADDFPMMYLTLTAERMDTAELTDIADRLMVDALGTVSGVAMLAACICVFRIPWGGSMPSCDGSVPMVHLSIAFSTTCLGMWPPHHRAAEGPNPGRPVRVQDATPAQAHVCVRTHRADHETVSLALSRRVQTWTAGPPARAPARRAGPVRSRQRNAPGRRAGAAGRGPGSGSAAAGLGRGGIDGSRGRDSRRRVASSPSPPALAMMSRTAALASCATT